MRGYAVERVASEQGVRRAGLTAGVALLVMSALSVYGILMTIQELWVEGDGAATAANVTGSELRFRVGVGCFALVAVLDLVVAYALQVVFAPVSGFMSTVAAGIRIVYAAVLIVAVGHLVVATQLLTARNSLTGGTERGLQSQALLELASFEAIWQAGLILFGIHLLVVAVLVIRSSYVPTWIGYLLIPAGAGYIADSAGLILVRDYSLSIGAVTFVGEAVLMFWLLLRSTRIRLPEPAA